MKRSERIKQFLSYLKEFKDTEQVSIRSALQINKQGERYTKLTVPETQVIAFICMEQAVSLHEVMKVINYQVGLTQLKLLLIKAKEQLNINIQYENKHFLMLKNEDIYGEDKAIILNLYYYYLRNTPQVYELIHKLTDKKFFKYIIAFVKNSDL